MMPRRRRHTCVLFLLLGGLAWPAAAQWRRAGARYDAARAAALRIAAPDAAALAIAERVRTDPGDLPRLVVARKARHLPLPLRHTDVAAEVIGPFARVTVTQTYQNPHRDPIEALYVFPLPENAAVDAMQMTIGARVIKAQIKTRAAARRTYDDARRRGHTAALLEQERPNVFTQSVANIAPGEEIEVELRYVQPLTWDAGEYELVFPMVVGPRFVPGEPVGASGGGWSADTHAVPDGSRITPPILGAGTRSGRDIDLRVTVDAGRPIVDLVVPTHDVDAAEHDGVLHVALARHDRLPNRDFVMRWAAAGEEPAVTVHAHRDPDAEGAREDGFFTLVVQPPKLDLDTVVGQREVVFVVDISGSMSGPPLAQAKDAMTRLISRLGPDDTFNVVTFAGSTGTLWETAWPANRSNQEAALRYIRQQRAGGGTLMNDAVERALGGTVAPGRHRYVVFLTDGFIGNETQIFASAEALVASYRRAGQRARVFTLGVGSSVNRHLIDGLARAGDGLGQVLTLREDSGEAVDRLYARIDRPVLEDVHIDWGALPVADVQPRFLPDLFATGPLVVHGRYTAQGVGVITVKGRVGEEAVELPVSVHLPIARPEGGALASVWARAKVTELERDRWHRPDTDAEAAITRLGLDFGLVTAFTSFVAVDDSRVVGRAGRAIQQPQDAPEGVGVPVAAAPATYPAPMATAPMSMAPRSRATSRSAPPRRPRGRDEVDDLLGSLDGAKAGGRPARARPAATPKPKGLPVRLSRRQVLRVVKENAAGIRTCKISDPGASGTILVDMVIAPDGRVSDARIKTARFKGTPVGRCVVEKVRAFRFPQFDGAAMRLSMPFGL